ncbi:MAG TPA: hypothetical protein VHK45_12670 [Geminicoccaceae bacterium]|nr:hypothetical protein [Geminicoccaceae bacterium]
MTRTAEDLVAWTVSASLEGLDQAELIAGYCERLTRAGVPLWRASIGADTLHPLIVAQGHRWLAGAGVEEEYYARAGNPEADHEWRQSPWYQMVTSGELQMRRRLAAGEGSNEFPLLAGLAAQGGTDYWSRIVPFGERRRIGETRGLATSWTTRDRGGFAERDLDVALDPPSLASARRRRTARAKNCRCSANPRCSQSRCRPRLRASGRVRPLWSAKQNCHKQASIGWS